MASNTATAKHEVRIVSCAPETSLAGQTLEEALAELLDQGFEIRAFRCTGDGSGSPICTTLLVKVVNS
jgi:hypothetical protein